MKRCVLCVLLVGLAIVLAGPVKGQEASQNKNVELKKYAVPGSEDAVGEIQTEGDRKVLDDFYRSGVQEQLHQAAMTNDVAKFDRLLADRMTWSAERSGKGAYALTKAQVLDDIRSGKLHANTDTHKNVHLVAFESSMVLVRGRDYSTLNYYGKVSNGPRLYVQLWIKLDGRWQMVAYQGSDVEEP